MQEIWSASVSRFDSTKEEQLSSLKERSINLPKISDFSCPGVVMSSLKRRSNNDVNNANNVQTCMPANCLTDIVKK